MEEKPTYEELAFRVNELEKDNESLKSSLTNYKDLYDNAPDLCVSVDAKTAKIINCNQTLIDQLGYSKDEIIGCSIFDMYTQDSAEIAREKVFPNFVKTGKIDDFELQLQRKDGTALDVSLNVSADYNENGDITHSRSVWRDITKRKQDLERTEQLNRLNEKLLNPDSLPNKLKLITDEVVRIFKADFARIWIINPGDLCEFECIHAKVMEGPHVCRERDRCLHLSSSSGRYTLLYGDHRRVPFGCYKIGKVASAEEPKFLTNDVPNDPNIHDHEWAKKFGLVSFAGYRLLSADKGVIGVLALFKKDVISLQEDAQLENLAGITAQVIQTTLAEEALQESEKKYKLLAENTADAIYKVNVFNEQYTYASPSTESLLGYTVKEIISLKPSDILTKESYAKQRQGLIDAIANGRSGSETLELDAIHKDGHIVPIEINASFILDEEGRPKEILGVARDITIRKKAQEALKEIEETARALLNATTESAFLIETDSTFITMNEVTAKRLGKKAEDLVGIRAYDLLPPEIVESRKNFIDETIHDKKPKRFEDERSGMIFDNSAFPIVDSEGTVKRIAIFSEDITKRKQAERTLIENKNYLNVLFNSTLSGIMVIDAETHVITDVNLTAIEAIGLPKENIVGQVCHNFVCPAELGKCPISDLGQELDKSERNLLTSKGETRSILKTAKPLSLGDKNYLIESFIDISELKQTEEALRKAENLFRAAVENSPIPMILASGTEEKVLKINRKFIELFGYDKRDIPDVSTWWPLAYPDPLYRKEIQKKWKREMQRASTEQSGVGPIEVTINCKDDSKKEVSVQASSIDDNRFITFVDLTELKAAEKEREKLIEDLKTALDEIKTLRGIIPICANCKKIRDDKGYWNQIESYIQRHSDAEFSHGICPECVKKLYPEFDSEG